MDDTIESAVKFYDDDVIIRAKDGLFKLCNGKNKGRKSCSSHPNVSVKYVEDILDLLSKNDDNPSVLPTCTAFWV